MGNYFIDLAYSRSSMEGNQSYYDAGFVDVANINRTFQRFVFSIGLNL